MSLQARQALVNSPNTVFQHDSQRHDLLDPKKTNTNLIVLFTYLCIEKGWAFEFTAIRTDHGPDGHLNPTPPHEGTHEWGFAGDGWPLSNTHAGDYLDATDPRFQAFLRDVDHAPTLMQVGLAGSAWTPANAAAAGSTVFEDDGADHVHLSVHV